MTTVKHRTARTRQWKAWSGTRQDIERIGRAARTLFDKRADSYINAVRADLDEDLVGKVLENEMDRVQSRMEFVATVTHGSDSSIGPLDDVLRELDRRSVSRMSIVGDVDGYGREQIKVEMIWSGDDSYARPGVTLEVNSYELGWANEAVATMSSEIDKGRPKWDVVHHIAARIALQTVLSSMILTIELWVILSLLGYGRDDKLYFSSPGNPLLWMLLVCGTTAVLITVLFMRDKSYHWIFPPVEIRGDGQDSTTIRRVALFVSPLVAFVLGLLVNVVSG